MPPDRIFGGIAVNALRSQVPSSDDALGIDESERVLVVVLDDEAAVVVRRHLSGAAELTPLAFEHGHSFLQSFDFGFER